MGDWKVRKLGAALGAEITGGSLANAGSREIDLIKSWLAEHHVIFFPGQAISVEEHVELGKHFGELEDHPNLKNPFTCLLYTSPSPRDGCRSRMPSSA